MSKYLPLLICAAAISCGSAYARYLSPEEALARAAGAKPAMVAGSQGPGAGLRLESTIGNLYVFTGEEGFAVLPDDDLAPAVLAYSDRGSFDPQSNPALAAWLASYNSELDYLRTRPAAVPSMKAEGSGESRPQREEIAPMIATRWNQESPYNELCPKVDGRETVTGCVATAMAQAMKFYNYPAHGTGTHSYLWRPGEENLTFDYENTPFQWTLMTDTYDSSSTEEARHAVAELMLGCGISVDMHYEPGESGAATTAMGSALIDIFGYSPALWMPNRAFYGYYEWENMIYSELSSGHPVLYSGAGTAGGHQFICDGYSHDGYFHFNWGWGGLSDGYYLLTALNPDDLGVGGGAGGFNTSQVATLGMRPAAEGDTPVYVFYNVIGFTSDVTAVTAGDDFRCGGQYFNYSLYTMPDGSRLGMKFVDKAGGAPVFEEGPDVGGYKTYDGRYDLQIRFPELPDGTYTITPALKVDGRWYDVRMPVGYAAEVTAVVKDNAATITDGAAAEVEVTDIDMPAVIYIDHEFPIAFKVSNGTELEYYGRVTPVLLNSDGTEAASSEFRPVDVQPLSEEDVTDYVASLTAAKDQELTPGGYMLVFKDGDGKEMSERTPVELQQMEDETTFTVSDFRLDSPDPVTDPADVQFSFTVTCGTGLFYSGLELLIFPGDGGYDVYSMGSERVYLTAGQSSPCSVKADLSELKDGHYMAFLYSGGKAVSDQVDFDLRRVTALEAPRADAPSSTVIYDLNGRRITTYPAPGLYIVNGHKTILR